VSKRAFFNLAALMACASATLLGGCRGDRFEDPPRRFFPDMDHQPKWNPQADSPFFENGSTARVPDPNAVAFGRMPFDPSKNADASWAQSYLAERAGFLAEDDAVYLGKAPDGSFVDYIPVEVTGVRMLRGQERFNIFCATCHGPLGNGQSPVAVQFIAKPVNLTAEMYIDPSLRTSRDGYIFEVIRNGVRNMPGYAHSIDAQDAWNIVMYVRALQKSYHSTLDDVPEAERDTLERARPGTAKPADSETEGSGG
jgi:mono/diheme cytochrome c family protein